jgi:hypothetical protein
MKYFATILIGLIVALPAHAATTDQQQSILQQLIRLITQEIAQLQAQLATEQSNLATSTPVVQDAPTLGSIGTPVEEVATSTPTETPLRVNIFEIVHGKLRVEANQPLNFASTTVEGAMLVSTKQPIITSDWFWTTERQHDPYPSYYYEGDLSGSPKSVTIVSLTGETMTREF